MNFYIHHDNPAEPPQRFPSDLSQFFEQYKGFGEQSEVGQTEAILDIDLSAFQDYTYGTVELDNWIGIQEITQLTRNFISKIQAHPDFWKAVEYTGVPAQVFREEFLRAKVAKDDKKVAEIVKRWQNTPDSAFPPDTNYLSSGKLLTDLMELEKIFVFLQKMKAYRVRLQYR